MPVIKDENEDSVRHMEEHIKTNCKRKNQSYKHRQLWLKRTKCELKSGMKRHEYQSYSSDEENKRSEEKGKKKGRKREGKDRRK